MTEVEESRLLEQTSTHLCAVAQSVLNGGERWEFSETDDGSTRVTLRTWRDRPRLSAWLQKVFGTGLSRAADLSLRKRLAYVQFQAERQS